MSEPSDADLDSALAALPLPEPPPLDTLPAPPPSDAFSSTEAPTEPARPENAPWVVSGPSIPLSDYLAAVEPVARELSALVEKAPPPSDAFQRAYDAEVSSAREAADAHDARTNWASESVCLHAVTVNGVCTLCGVPALNPTRDWLDWSHDGPSSLGKPRLRVASIEDARVPPPPMEDHDGWRERHRQYQQAKADHDDAKIAKLFPQVLDELHSEAPKFVPPPLDWDELEPALVAELREWGKSHGAVKSGAIGLQRLLDASCVIRIAFRDATYELHCDRQSVKAAWRESEGQPRRAAAILVLRATEELAHKKRSEIIVAPS